MVDPLYHLIFLLLTPNPGLNSGLMIAEVTSAALMSENKHLANPVNSSTLRLQIKKIMYLWPLMPPDA